MRILSIIDPPHLLNPATDTTVAILDEALRRGHQLFVCQMGDLWLHGDEPGADVLGVEAVSRVSRPALTLAGEPARSHSLSHFHAVLMRKDPPYDGAYHLATLLLERARGRTLLVNDPRGLREANEKLYIFNFPELLTPTIVTNRADRLRSFLGEQGGQMVVKPLDGHGGIGIFHVQQADKNTNAIIEISTDEGRKWVMAQRYLPEAREGDKRILLLDGEPIGAVLRVPRSDDSRGNLHVGGTAQAAPLTERDRVICARIAPRLRRDGLHFVGIDVIGGFLTEVNVTSPTGVQEIDRLENTRVEAPIVSWLEKMAPRSL
jgi:glutathione synthase